MKANNPAKKPPLQVTCDARELFTGEQAARYLQIGNDRIRQAVSKKALCPARVGKYSLFTRRDLDRYKRLEREHEIARQLVAGTHPLDIYLGAPSRWTMRDVSATMLDWARLSGVWIVEGPRGSYARWLERLGLVRCTPRELRRIIEALVKDPELRARVRGLFVDQRVNNGRPARSASGAAAQRD